jgi:hypothetical protein
MTNRVLLSGGAALAIALAAVSLSSCQTAPTKSTNLARTHVAEPATPAQKRYTKTVEDDRLGPIWYQLVKLHRDEVDIGTVTVTFDIPAAGGKVENVQVTSITGGRMDTLIALRAIDQLRAPPIPAQVLAELRSDHMQLEESFTIFANR